MTTLADMTLRLATKAGSVRRSIATSGDNISLTDTYMASQGKSVGGVIWFLSGDAEGKSRIILTNPQNKFTFDPLSPVAVRVASTAKLTLSGEQTIDGHAVIAGNRVLAKDQTGGDTGNPFDNGVYVVATGAWTRATDFNTWAEFVSATVVVEEGTVNAGRGWRCNVDAGGTLGTTAITWVGGYGINTGDRYAFVDRETPRDILIAAVNAGLRQVDPRSEEDHSLSVGS